VLLVSWIFLTISATCSMPSLLIATSDHMPGCLESGAPAHTHHHGHTPEAMQDCSFKPCFESQAKPFPEFNRLLKPDLPVFIVSFIWTFGGLFFVARITGVPRVADSPPGRWIPLFYRFCTLLN
jgi:hypothetical protein